MRGTAFGPDCGITAHAVASQGRRFHLEEVGGASEHGRLNEGGVRPTARLGL